VSCVWFLFSYCVVGAQCCLCRVYSFCFLTAWWGAQCCLCRVYSFCLLTVWWVPNVVCVVCIVFVFLLCGGCPMLSVSFVWFMFSYCVVGAQFFLCRVCGFCFLTVKTKTTQTTQTTLGTHHAIRKQKPHTRHRQHWAPTTQ
jgi:hypothetical protein